MAKTTQQKLKSSQKKEKGVIKTKSVIKVKLPQKKATSAAKSQNRNAKIFKNGPKTILANEVVSSQFPEKLSCTGSPSKINVDKKPITKSKNKKPVTKVESSQKNVEHSNDVSTGMVKKKINKVVKKQENVKVDDDTSCKTSKDAKHVQVEKQTSKPIILRRGRSSMQSVGEAKKESEVQKLKPKPKTPKSIPAKSKPEDASKKNVNEDISDESKEKINNLEDKNNSENSLKSRKNSCLSELSWIKDISSSSTTSCITVSTNDFFRFNNKVPLVKLQSIDGKTKKCQDSDQSDKEISSTESVVNLPQENFEDIDIPLPPLSLSSLSSDMSISKPDKKPENISDLLKKISNNLKSLDLEVIDWMGHTDEESTHSSDILKNRRFQNGFLEEERDVILACREINNLLLGKEGKNQNLVDEEVIKGNDNKKMYEQDNNTVENTNLTQSIEKRDLCVENVQPNVSLTENDDDDTLSLFAQSITGLDSLRRISTRPGVNVNLSNENIPETTQCTFKTPEVQSSVITPRNAANANPVSDIKKKSDLNDSNISKCRIITKDVVNVRQPVLLSSIHKPIQGVKSLVFRGVCFFYQISSCKNTNCKFPHNFLSTEEVKSKLPLLNEGNFIKEYILVKSYQSLRRKYGECFVDECIERKLSSMLVEMSIDFIIKSMSSSKEDEILKTNVAEKVLLYLNEYDLIHFADLLLYKVQFDGLLLCDFYISTISKSQNFSRFKSVFVKLTDFMSDMRRSYDNEVATNLLDRISILPYDERLALGLMKVIKNTDAIIFANPLIKHLEKQFLSSNVELHSELMHLKEKKLPHTVENYPAQSIIKKTVDINEIGLHLKAQASQSNNDKPTGNVFDRWKNMSTFDRSREKPPDQLMMTSRWSGAKFRLGQCSEAGPSKYQKTPPSE